MSKFILSVLLLICCWLVPSSVDARITPEDTINSQRNTFNQKVSKYSSEHQQKLDQISQHIQQINKSRTEELDHLMIVQAAILEEYQRRVGNTREEEIENARYWVTYAHEAVAYQAAKIYIYDLTTESNIRSDASRLISLFRSDLESTRQKVIKSQKIVEGTVR
jgi:hypothetical protein